MAQKLEIYKCLKCGNVVEVLVEGNGELVCCGEPMKLMDEKNKEGAGEKHIPIIEEVVNGILIKVGSVPHPMEEDHYIQFVEVIMKDGKIGRKDFKPGDEAEAYFNMKPEEVAWVRSFCDKHGLWSK